MTEPVYISIGLVRRAHGLKGEVLVKPLTDFPDRFLSTGRVWLGRQGQPHPRRYPVLGARPHSGGYLLELEGVRDRREAEALRGQLVQVPEEDLVPLDEGRYYIYRLIDVPVYSEEGDQLGRVADILAAGGTDVWVVRPPQGDDILVPGAGEFIKRIDLDEGKVIVHLWPGMVSDRHAGKPTGGL